MLVCFLIISKSQDEPKSDNVLFLLRTNVFSSRSHSQKNIVNIVFCWGLFSIADEYTLEYFFSAAGFCPWQTEIHSFGYRDDTHSYDQFIYGCVVFMGFVDSKKHEESCRHFPSNGAASFSWASSCQTN